MYACVCWGGRQLKRRSEGGYSDLFTKKPETSKVQNMYTKIQNKKTKTKMKGGQGEMNKYV